MYFHDLIPVPCIDYSIQVGKIIVRKGNFKKVRKFDPFRQPLELDYSSSGLEFQISEGFFVRWFTDNNSLEKYFVMYDEDEKIIAGAVVEYSSASSLLGVVIREDNSVLFSPLKLDADKKQRKHILSNLLANIG